MTSADEIVSNLYDRNWAAQCEPVNIRIIDSGSASHQYVPTFSIPPTHAELVNAQRQGYDTSNVAGVTVEANAAAAAEARAAF